MIPPFNAALACWKAEDGRIFSAVKAALVPVTDQAYLDAEAAALVTTWPRDDAGEQTDAALTAQLALYGLGFPDAAVLPDDLVAYAAAARYTVEIAGVMAEVGGAQVPVSTKREDRDGLRDTLAAIAQGWRKDGATFKFADGISRSATNAEMQAAIAAAFAHVQAAYDREPDVVAKITAKRPTITTRDAVDQAFADLRGGP